jgi:hypothetical protein
MISALGALASCHGLHYSYFSGIARVLGRTQASWARACYQFGWDIVIDFHDYGIIHDGVCDYALTILLRDACSKI